MNVLQMKIIIHPVKIMINSIKKEIIFRVFVLQLENMGLNPFVIIEFYMTLSH